MLFCPIEWKLCRRVMIRAQQSRTFRNIAARNLMPDAYLYVNVRARASWCSSLLCVGLTSASSVCAWVLSLLSAIFWSRLFGFYTPVCVFFFFPFILDIKFVGRTSRGHTGGRSHRISHPPSFCGACLKFSREKDSAIPFPRRP